MAAHRTPLLAAEGGPGGTREPGSASQCGAQETLRLYSLVPVVVREAQEDDDLEGLFVPAGTKIMINTKVSGSKSLGAHGHTPSHTHARTRHLSPSISLALGYPRHCRGPCCWPAGHAS